MRPALAFLLLLAACGGDRQEAEQAAGPEHRTRDPVARLGTPGGLEAFVAGGLLGRPEARLKLAALLDDPAAAPVARIEAGLLLEAGSGPAEAETLRGRVKARLKADEEGRRLLRAEGAGPGAVDRAARLGAVGALLETAGDDTQPLDLRLRACLALGSTGSLEAACGLARLLGKATGDPARAGPLHLYAAAGLTLLAKPATAVDLLENLSTINPNDYLAARALEGAQGEYWTIDAQICEALLALGLWEAEEELVEQMERRAYVRVLIDAYAVLRRRTGLALPFRYNASYADRRKEAEAWRAALRASRRERYARRPFDAADPGFRLDCERMMAWLRGRSVNDRYIARKVVVRLGPYALPFLCRELASAHPVAQRQAALLLGRIGDPAAAPDLRAALARIRDADALAEAVTALRELGDAQARPRVRELLAHEDAEVRGAAARFLGALGRPEDIEALRGAQAVEQAPSTATMLLCARLRLGDREAAGPLLEIFVEGSPTDRGLALEALEAAAGGRKCGADALAPLEERIEAARRMRAWFREK